jgi:uncharacterized protein YjbJ (UPF0337 family)
MRSIMLGLALGCAVLAAVPAVAQTGTTAPSSTWEKIKGGWTDTKGVVKEQWGKLTDDDLMEIQGRREQLIGKIQARYGVTREEAERQVRNWEQHQK